MNTVEKDLGILSDNPKVVARCEAIAKEYGYTFKIWKTVDQFLEEKDFPKFLIASQKDPAGNPLRPSELAQVVRTGAAAESFLACVVPTMVSKDEAAFAKKCGASLVLLDSEILDTGKFEFICTQTLRSRFLPVKAVDLLPGVALMCDLYHLMPQRKKFVKFAWIGDEPDSNKLEKMLQVGELYFERESADAYKQYVLKTADRSVKGLAKRCRAQFLSLYSGFSTLAFQLSNQSEHASFGEGQALLKRCKELCDELLGTLAESGKAWEVINNSAIGDFGSIERAPAIAAYTGVFGLRMGLENVSDLMITALLADLGLLFLNPKILKKIRDGAMATFTQEERGEYEAYPLKSLEIVLGQKLSLSEKLRTVLTSTQERVDGKGFPKKPPEDRIPREAQLIGFCREYDLRTLIRLGRPRPDALEVLKKMLEPGADPGRFREEFLNSLRAALGDLGT